MFAEIIRLLSSHDQHVCVYLDGIHRPDHASGLNTVLAQRAPVTRERQAELRLQGLDGAAAVPTPRACCCDYWYARRYPRYRCAW